MERNMLQLNRLQQCRDSRHAHKNVSRQPQRTEDVYRSLSTNFVCCLFSVTAASRWHNMVKELNRNKNTSAQFQFY